MAVLYANKIAELRRLTEHEIAGQVAPPQATSRPRAARS